MRTRTRILFGALVAAVVVAGGVGTASARRLALDEERGHGFRATWEGGNSLTLESGPNKAICEVTLEGSFHSRTLSKVCGQLIGYVTTARMRHPCTGGEAWWLNGVEVLEGVTVANTLPWHVQYNSFAGTLPRITRVRIAIVNQSVLVKILNVKCLYRSTQAHPQFYDLLLNEMGAAAQIQALPEPQIPFNSGEVLCPAEIALNGTGALRIQGGVSVAITIRLVQ
jgi:hypothetical protein